MLYVRGCESQRVTCARRGRHARFAFPGRTNWAVGGGGGIVEVGGAWGSGVGCEAVVGCGGRWPRACQGFALKRKVTDDACSVGLTLLLSKAVKCSNCIGQTFAKVAAPRLGFEVGRAGYGTLCVENIPKVYI